MPQIHGGPLDGLAIENLPGPFLAAVVAWRDPRTGEVMSAVLEGTCDCQPKTPESLATIAAAARTHLTLAGHDPDAAIATVEAGTRFERIHQPGGGGPQ